GDLGAALKVRTDLSSRAAVALVPSVTAPTGSEARGLGAGRALGGLVGVVSADLPGVHVDVNAGPQGIGAGTPPWFVSLGGSGAFGRAGLAVELLEFTPGGAGSGLAGGVGAWALRAAQGACVRGGGA